MCVFTKGRGWRPTSAGGFDDVDVAVQFLRAGLSGHLDPIGGGDVAPQQLLPDRRRSVNTPALRTIGEKYRLDHSTTTHLTQPQI